MVDRDVRFERLGPLRVAVAHGFGPSPELAALETLRAWAEPKGLLKDRAKNRIFGHNNPPPSGPDQDYGYDFMIVVGPEVTAEGPIHIREIPAKRWATTRTCVRDIRQAWIALFAWCGERDLEEEGTGLEELLSPLDVPPEELEFRLWLPVSD